jgi:aromatic ring-opening dioxygenase LigB subunit
VYRQTVGDLDGFGKRGIEVERATDPTVAAPLAEAWGHPLLDGRCDHGVVVPLLAGTVPEAPVVACTLDEVTGPEATPVVKAIEDARSFATALASVVDERNILFVASAHTSAALTPQAPLTLREEGIALDAEIKNALDNDVGRLASIDPELWAAGGACGVGPLVALGLLFAGSKAEIAWYDHPFGVGYMLALVA